MNVTYGDYPLVLVVLDESFDEFLLYGLPDGFGGYDCEVQRFLHLTVLGETRDRIADSGVDLVVGQKDHRVEKLVP